MASITGWAKTGTRNRLFDGKAPPSENKAIRARYRRFRVIAAVVKTTGIVKIETIEPMIAKQEGVSKLALNGVAYPAAEFQLAA